MECRDAAEHIPAYVDQPGGPAARALGAHLRTCDHCRAELDTYRQMQEALGLLAAHTIEPPAWLLPATIDAVRSRSLVRLRIPAAAGAARERLADPKVAVAGAGAAALVLAGALLVRGRRRRRRRLLVALA